MERSVLLQILEKLKDLEYCFFAGTAVAAYSNGKRQPGDLDILVHEKDIDKFAQRMGCKAEKRIIKKANFIIEDYGFETIFLGQQIEAVSGFPKRRMETIKMQKTFKNKVKMTYLGCEVFLTPIEELLAHKAFLHRDKDINDLILLKGNPINSDLVKEFAEDWGDKEGILSVLRKIGYNL